MELVNNERALYTAFLCIGYGLICGACYTALLLLQLKKHRRPWQTAVTDTAFCVIIALGLFLLSLSLTDGRPRFWLFAGTALGFFGWKRGFERPIRHGIQRCRAWIFRKKCTIGQRLLSMRSPRQKKLSKN